MFTRFPKKVLIKDYIIDFNNSGELNNGRDHRLVIEIEEVYDKTKIKTRKTKINLNGTSSFSEEYYNYDAELITRINKVRDGKDDGYVLYVYDDSNRLVRTDEIASPEKKYGVQEVCSRFLYAEISSEEDIIAEDVYFDGTICFVKSSLISEGKKVYEKVCVFEDGELQDKAPSVTVYEYNDNGYTVIRPDGSKRRYSNTNEILNSPTSEYQYKYDDHGNWVQKLELKHGVVPTRLSIREIEY